MVPSRAQENVKQEELYWYDKNTKITLSIDPDRWMEFSTQKSVKPSEHKRNLVEKDYGHAKLYRHSTTDSMALRDSLDGLSTKETAERNGMKYSEIFNVNGSVASLPGDILVSFKKNWDAEKIKNWGASNGLLIKQKLLQNINLWVVGSPSGIESLKLANKLTEQGEVNYATPNWWRPLTLR